MASYKDRTSQNRADYFQSILRSRKLRAGLRNLSGFQENRNLFEQINQDQESAGRQREPLARASASASGGSGSEAARLHQAKYQGGERALPPKPPGEPTKPVGGPAHALPWDSPLKTPENLRGRYSLSGLYELGDNPFEVYNEVYGTASGSKSPVLRERYTDLFHELYPGALFINSSEHKQLQQSTQGNTEQYDKDYAQWKGIDDIYQKDLKAAQDYNSSLGAANAATKEGKAVAESKRAAAGQGSGGGELGVSQGAINSSVGLGMVKREDTIWI